MSKIQPFVKGLEKYLLFFLKKAHLINERNFTDRYIRLLRKMGVDIADYDIDSFIAETVYFDSYDRHRIHIGKNVYLTNDVIILVHDQSAVTVYNSQHKGNENRGTIYAPNDVRIGNNVFIGMRSILLPGTVIEDNVIIGAGSIVKGKIPSGTIWAGVPAKQIGMIDQQYARLSARGVFDEQK